MKNEIFKRVAPVRVLFRVRERDFSSSANSSVVSRARHGNRTSMVNTQVGCRDQPKKKKAIGIAVPKALGNTLVVENLVLTTL